MEEDQTEVTPAPQDTPAITDGLLIGAEGQYFVEGITDAEAGGPLSVKLLTALANTLNTNGRYYTDGFLRAKAVQADADCKRSPIYGEEPHPPYDSDRGQFVTDSTKEVWRHEAWMCDDDGNLWSRVSIDETTERGKRLGVKARRGEKLGVSNRMHNPQGKAKRGTVGGKQALIFDAEIAPYVKLLCADHVPNPAFVNAGRVVMDAEAPFALLDATDPALAADPSYTLDADVVPHRTPTTSLADAPAAAPETPCPLAVADAQTNGGITPASGRRTSDKEREKKPMKEKIAALREKAAAASDEATRSVLLDAASALEAQNTPDHNAVVEAVLDKLSDPLGKLNEFITTQNTEKATRAERDQVIALADAVESGTIEGVDLARFTSDEARKALAKGVRNQNTVEAAKVALSTGIAIMDSQIAAASRIALGAETPKSGAEGHAAQEAQDRVEIIADAGDKALQQVTDSLNEAWDEIELGAGIKRDPVLQKQNEKFYKKHIAAHIFGEEGQKNEAGRPLISTKALVDSAQYLLSSPEERRAKKYGRISEQAMLDAQMLVPSGQTDAAIGTGSILNQATITSVLLQRIYQNLESMQYAQGLGMDSFTHSPGSVYNFGTSFRVMSEFYTPPANDANGTEFSSLYVAEGAAIPEATLQSSWQEFGVTPRRIAVSLTKDLEMSLLHGPVNYNPVARALFHIGYNHQRNTDNLVYTELNTAIDEINAVVVVNESVASANIRSGNVQDGLVYDPVTVAVVAQPNAGGNLAAPVATRISDNSANASTSNAYRVPIVQPRTTVTQSALGVKSMSTINNISVTAGGTPLTRGYLTPAGAIASFPNTTAQYAVDYARGKFVFTSGAGITPGTTAVVLNYTYATNVTYTQINFGAAGYPGGVTDAVFFNNILEGINFKSAQMGSYPNYSRPNTILSRLNLAAKIQSAALFYVWEQPNGTSLGPATANNYGRRAEIDLHQVNAPAVFGEDTALFFRKGWVKYGVDTPWTTQGPFIKYDQSTGSLTDTVAYKAQEFSVFCTPQARDNNGNILNIQASKNVYY